VWACCCRTLVASRTNDSLLAFAEQILWRNRARGMRAAGASPLRRLSLIDLASCRTASLVKREARSSALRAFPLHCCRISATTAGGRVSRWFTLHLADPLLKRLVLLFFHLSRLAFWQASLLHARFCSKVCTSSEGQHQRL
jgi:hypothetical protein